MLQRLFSRRPAPRLRVLMVCMGNLCRSPMAEAVLRAKLVQAGLDRAVAVDSAGTLGAFRGSPPDPRAVARAAARGYRLDAISSRPLADADFERFDLLLAMDRDNLERLRERGPAERQDRLQLLLPFAAQAGGKELPADEVPDPYYGPPAAFDAALDLIEPACDGLLQHLRRQLA
jgi:protein-tyrosine phosphatase